MKSISCHIDYCQKGIIVSDCMNDFKSIFKFDNYIPANSNTGRNKYLPKWKTSPYCTQVDITKFHIEQFHHMVTEHIYVNFVSV